MIRWLAALAVALTTLIASPASAYWEYGHGVVARIAYEEVRPETRAKIDALMARYDAVDTPTCPFDTIEDVAYWADCVKPLGDRYAPAFPWHYQNVNICETFSLSEPCANGNCVAAQIERHARLLADIDLPMHERIEALAFLTHFVGDLHQPMHAGDMADRGGNDVPANYGLLKGRRLNLHAIFDGYLAERAFTTSPGGARGLVSTYDRATLEAYKGGDVVQWSREMWIVSKDYAYPLLLDTIPCDTEVTRKTLTEEDVQVLIPIMREAAVKGGMRLARLLDDALSEGKAPRFRRL
ncbi:S1/P1 nuclease [Sphingomicrobium sediminis]|uniref:S1/P1 nuclease n=1 Tax=Sphingomicrobium sediminis TaxID=2950949 RepID=A0A9X2J5E5_9SPHN|nr:S1/P1 nuclease [Sphingomicrobium sediminis]MCM8558177.1 S1/P1 nuclease [Sphingomicrobium sediminis]